MTAPLRITIDQPDAAPASPGAASAPAPTHRASAFDYLAREPWAITPEVLTTIAAIARREGEGVDAVEARLGRPLQNARKVSLRGDVAVVPVTGPVFRYANLMTEISGATSLEVLARDFTTAIEDPNVRAVVLAIDSPGGQAAGIADFAALVRASASANGKRVIAHVDNSAASAAYWIAAAANEIVLSKTAMVGSIGVVLTIDPTRSKAGAIEIVSAQSPKKRPDVTTDAGRAQLQALTDKLGATFISDVAAFRGVPEAKVLADFGQGDMLIGAEAVAAGMADRVGTLEDVIAGIAGNTAPQTQQGAITMDLDTLRADHGDLVAQIEAAARQSGATAERERILGIEAQALPGHDALIAQYKADGKTSPAEAAIGILAAERGVVDARRAAIGAGAPAAVPHAAAPKDQPAETDASLPIEQRAKAKWDTDAALRAEFGTVETYLAYAKAHDAGLVRVISK